MTTKSEAYEKIKEALEYSANYRYGDGDVSYLMKTALTFLPQLMPVKAGDDEQSLNTCPNCGGVADNGHDRCYPPNPYYCTKCSIKDPRKEGDIDTNPKVPIHSPEQCIQTDEVIDISDDDPIDDSYAKGYAEGYKRSAIAAMNRTAPLYLHGEVVTETWDKDGNETRTIRKPPALPKPYFVDKDNNIRQMVSPTEDEICTDLQRMKDHCEKKDMKIGIGMATAHIRNLFKQKEGE